MKNTILTLSGLAALTLISCENPADKSSKAETSPPKSVPDEPAVGKKWTFTKDSKITFVGSKVTRSHNGGFHEFDGYFHVTSDTLAASGNKLVIDMTTTYADDDKLTEHLKSPDFFDVEK